MLPRNPGGHAVYQISPWCVTVYIVQNKSGKRVPEMRAKDIIQLLIGTKNQKLCRERHLSRDSESSDLGISEWPTKKEQCQYGVCHRKAKHYDSGRTLDIGVGKVFIEAPVSRVCCKNHGVVVAAVPWERHDSRFYKIFEEQAAWLITTRTLLCGAAPSMGKRACPVSLSC